MVWSWTQQGEKRKGLFHYYWQLLWCLASVSPSCHWSHMYLLKSQVYSMADSFNITLHPRSPGLLPLKWGGKGKMTKSKVAPAQNSQPTQKQVALFSSAANNESASYMLIIPAVFYVLMKYGFIIVLRASRDDPLRRGWRRSLYVNKHLALAHLSFQGLRPVSWLNSSDWMNK